MRGKIIAIVLVVLTFFAIQDLIINGPEVVIGGYFEKIAAHQTRYAPPDPDSLKSKSTVGTIESDSNVVNGLVIVNPSGNIDIKGVAGEKMTIDYKINVMADDTESAAKYLEQISIQKIDRDGRLELNPQVAKIRSEKIRNVEIAYEIGVPKGLEIDITNNRGPVDIRNLNGDIRLAVMNGPVTAKDITGKLRIDSKHSDIEIEGLKGNLQLKTFSGAAYIANIEGDLNIQGQDCDIFLENIKGNMEAQNGHGNFEVVDLFGNLKLRSYYGNVLVEDVAGSVKISQSGHEGDIDLENIVGDVDASSETGNIRFELQEGKGYEKKGYEISALVGNLGNIRTRLPLTIEENENRKSAEGKIGSGEWKVKLETTERGNIYIR